MMIKRIRQGIEHERPVLGGLFLVMLLLLLPTLVTTFYPAIDFSQGESFWMGAGIILLPASLGLTLRQGLMCWVPFSALIPATLLYAFYARAPLREWAIVVGMVAQHHEIERFITPFIAAAVLAPLAVWGTWRLIHHMIPRGHRLSGVTRVVTVTLSVILPLGNLARSGWEMGSTLVQVRLSAISPIGPVVAAVAAWRLKSDLDARGSISTEAAVKPARTPGREIYVLVIGESARYASFQLNGYERETTPLLARTPGLLSFHNVIAPATVTLMSVPVLLTPVRAIGLRTAPKSPSVISVFRQAGYRTAWLSTQKQHGRYDTACSIFSMDAHESKFLSGSFAPAGGAYASALDGELLAPLREIVGRGDEKLFIVVHTMGSHQDYGDRFPAEFNVFASRRARVDPERFDGTYSEEQITNLTNAYDNTIRYTDWVLSQIIETLRGTGAITAMVYVSDHGQNSGRAKILPFAHGALSWDVAHVPMIVWQSDAYRATHPRQSAALESHVETPISSDTTFHTLTDMAEIKTPLLRHERSVASGSFVNDHRMLRNLDGLMVNYDETP